MNIQDAVYIFGAHSRARTLYMYLKKINPRIKVINFLIDNNEDNPDNIDGIKVINISSEKVNCGGENPEIPVYISTRGVFHESITNHLKKSGFSTFIPVTPQLDIELRNKFLRIYYEENNRNFCKFSDYKLDSELNVEYDSTCVYVIKSAVDRPLLKERDNEILAYEKVLQVGADLTDIYISDFKDNTGDNISVKNKQFCELTGMYWLWKNSIEEIVGLEHYRRRFILHDGWKDIMKHNNIDVILPTPLYVDPSLAENYRLRHIRDDLDYVYEYFKRNNTEEADDLVEFMEQTSIYSPCNMFIMKRDALVDLCEWLFPILFALADYSGMRDDQYQNRYPGFMSERLISYYFEHNKYRYKVVYADKDFRQ